MSESFLERAARLRAEVDAAKAAAEPPKMVFDDDLIPKVDEGSTYEPTDVDREVDRICDEWGILDAYRRYCGKMEPRVGKKRESIMISCPYPDHQDDDPSAWMNLDKDTFYCGCGRGGDKYDIAAWHFGYPVPGYKEGKLFPELKRQIAEDIGGIVIKRDSRGESYIVPVVEPEDESDSEEPPAPSAPSDTESSTPAAEPHLTVVPEPDEPDTPDATVTTLIEDEREIVQIAAAIPRIEWESMVKPGTFLYEWMNVMRRDDLPEAFYFWHGLIALGMAAGRDVVLMDRNPVFANLFICLFGPSGQGKSRSTSHLSRLLREALPYDKSDPKTKGTLMAPMPGSPEVLIDLFSKPIIDPSDPKIVTGWAEVRALLRFGELSTLTSRANRAGTPLKPALHDIYDGLDHLATASRGHGIVEAYNAFGSMVTTTQPRAIRSVLVSSDVDSGFVNRFVFVMGHAKPPISFGGPSLDITEPVKLLMSVHAWASFGRPLYLDDDAMAAWDKWYQAEMVQYHEGEDNIDSRIPLLMKKIILLLSINAKEMVVSLDTINSAIMLYPYIRATFAYLSGDLGTGEREELDNAILVAAKRFEADRGRAASARDIVQRLPKRLPRDAGTIRRCLDDLCALGFLKEEVVKPAGHVGRSTTRYSVTA